VGERIGIGGADRPGGRAVAAALRARGHDVADDPAGCAVVVDCATAPTAPGEPVRFDALGPLLSAAEDAGALLVFASSALVYGDGADEWLEAPEPLLDAGSPLAPLLDLELEVFSSGVRFLVLRQGILLAPGTPGTAALLGARARLTDAWVPLLHPDDLGALVVRAVEEDLHGVWDAVSDVVRGTELAATPGVASGAEPGWDVSRRVRPLEGARAWRDALYEASASQRA
jgi:nucleoside-diphosphate-sugar epimerase